MILHFGLLVFPGVQQLDLTGPYDVFALVPGAKVHLIWKDRSPVTSATGLVLTPTATFAECPVLDVLCVPGGGGINALLQDPEVLVFLRTQAAQARYVSSVCTGALMLGAAGLPNVAELVGETQAQVIQLGHEYVPEPPFRAGSPDTAPPEVLAAARARVASIRRAREAIIDEIVGSGRAKAS